MNIPLPKFKFVITVFLLFIFSGKADAQCSITTTTNTSSLPSCGNAPLNSCNGILYIGDGINAMTLTMDSALNLTCLGPIQLIVRNKAKLDFTEGNDYLTLAAGSSIVFESGSALSGDNCNASERIYIGGVLVASCNGNNAQYNFTNFFNNGGYAPISAVSNPTSVCGSGSFTLTATANSTNLNDYKWYDAQSGGTLLYTGNPYVTPVISSTKTFYVLAEYNTYSTVRAAVTATVNPLPATPTISACCSTTFCTGGSVTLSSSAASGYQWYNGSVAIPGATSVDYIATTSGTYTVITNNVTCESSPSAGTTVTVNALPATPTLSGATAATCATDGSFAITNYNAAYTYTVTPSTGVIQSGATITAPAGSYTVTATAGTCSSSVSSPIVILSSTTTWDGSSWDNGLPTSDKSLVFNGAFSSSSDLEGCSCTVNSGFSVVINSGHTLRITNSVTTYGQLIFEDKSSLVQINSTPGINTGAIEYRRISSPMKNYDFTYWSSPVEGQTTVALSPNTLADKYFRFSASANNWVLHQGVMKPGEGYIIRVPKPGTYTVYPEVVTSPAYSQPVAFKGVPNNGDYNFAVGANQWNLIGNPYPSAINADDFINENWSLINGGALYFWTHNTAIQLASNITNGSAGSGVYAYTSDDYATYTLVGGTDTVGNFVDANNNGTIDSGEEMISNKPNGFIAAGQSFFVGNTLAGNFKFKNAMRLVGNNSQFFKIANTKKTKTIEKNRVWLNLTNSQGAFKQLLVGYLIGATNSWDNLYDGSSFDGNSYVNFYSINEKKNLSIQGRSLPFDENDQVPLGYNAKIAGEKFPLIRPMAC